MRLNSDIYTSAVQLANNVDREGYEFMDDRRNTLFEDPEGAIAALMQTEPNATQDELAHAYLQLLGGGLFGEYIFLEGSDRDVLSIRVIQSGSDAQRINLPVSDADVLTIEEALQASPETTLLLIAIAPQSSFSVEPTE